MPYAYVVYDHARAANVAADPRLARAARHRAWPAATASGSTTTPTTRSWPAETPPSGPPRSSRTRCPRSCAQSGANRPRVERRARSSAPAARARGLALPERTLGVRDRPGGRLALRARRAVRPHDSRPVLARDAGERSRRHRLLRGVLVPPTLARRRLGPQDRLLLHFGAVDYSATVWIEGALAGAHEGGYTPFAIDVTDYVASSANRRGRRARRRRPARPREAARQAGLAARPALDLVPAHDRHLADRLVGGRSRRRRSARSAGRRTSSAGRSASRRASTGRRPRTCASR